MFPHFSILGERLLSSRISRSLMYFFHGQQPELILEKHRVQKPLSLSRSILTQNQSNRLDFLTLSQLTRLSLSIYATPHAYNISCLVCEQLHWSTHKFASLNGRTNPFDLKCNLPFSVLKEENSLTPININRKEISLRRC